MVSAPVTAGLQLRRTDPENGFGDAPSRAPPEGVEPSPIPVELVWYSKNQVSGANLGMLS